MNACQSPDLPSGGKHEGRDGFKQWSKKMSSYFSSLEVLNPKDFESSDSVNADQVLAPSTLKLKTREPGRTWIAPLA